jgi:hypothetical protein
MIGVTCRVLLQCLHVTLTGMAVLHVGKSRIKFLFTSLCVLVRFVVGNRTVTCLCVVDIASEICLECYSMGIILSIIFF